MTNAAIEDQEPSSTLSNLKPDFAPRIIDCGSIPAYQYRGDVLSETQAGTLDADQALWMLEDMLMVREAEEMIIRLRSGAYDPLADFSYYGPTHVSIGQEATAVGAAHALGMSDHITSTHRGHGESIARGCAVIRRMEDRQLRQRLGLPETGGGPGATDVSGLLEKSLDDHLFRTIAELFGKQDGYCHGRGGGMHIADYAIGHLGANAIVGGSVPIATGAALACRYLENDRVVCCFAGDGAYSNGVVLESLNFAAQKQFMNAMAGDRPFGLPVIFFVVNNHFAMTGRSDGEICDVDSLARRAAGFSEHNMHAEVVNGMDVLAVRNAVIKAREICRSGKGPVLIEANTYRYYGHSLSDPRHEYRLRDEEAAWKAVDPIAGFSRQLMEAGILTDDAWAAMNERVALRNEQAAVRAAASADPDAADVIKHIYNEAAAAAVPETFTQVETLAPPPETKRDANGNLSYRDAIKEALIEEMLRDRRVIFYGEDVADYGGAFKLSKGLLESFGRKRVFNAPISESAICGSAVGAAMVGLRPVAELMYMDFALQASDQISNQAGKWHYMSGGNVQIPLVYRASVGGGKGYGGQHSQTLESIFTHIPGLYVVYPATPRDAKGLLKTSIRDNNPVMFIESQLLYGSKGPVPEDDYTIPLGKADIKREGADITLITWGPALHDCLKAAQTLEGEGISAEVIDLRCLVPLDMDTLLASVEKTGRCVVVSQAVNIGSYTAEIAANIQQASFDYLDAPIIRVGAANGTAPQSQVLEKAFLPNERDILDAVNSII